MFTIRPLDPSSDAEIRTAVAFSLMTVWETMPELRSVAPAAHGFSFEEMEKSTRLGLARADTRHLLAFDQKGEVCGHTVFSLKHEEDGTPYGYCLTRYVLPTHRNKYLASRFLREALHWFDERGAAFVMAHAHSDNPALAALFERFGFHVVDQLEGKWPTRVLRLDLQPRATHAARTIEAPNPRA